MQTIPSKAFYRLKEIIGDEKNNIPSLIPIGRTTWLEGVKSGKYPQPIHLSKRTIAWKSEDISELIETLGRQKDEC